MACRGTVVIAVTGSHGKTTTALLLERLYRDAGHRVAACCTEGVFRDGRLVHAGDFAGANGIWRALRAHRPDVLIAETARGGLLKWGAGFTSCHAAAVTCVAGDHLGIDGIATLEQMARLKGEVVARVRADGVAALNQDDPLVRAMASRSRAPVCWATSGPAPGTGPAVFPRDGQLWSRDESGEEPVAELARIGLLDGGLRPYNLTAVSLAVAIARGLRGRLPVTDPALRGTLESFGRAPGDVPCRNELLRWGDDWLLLGSATHPVAAAHDAQLIAGLRSRLGIRRVHLLLCALEDRGAEAMREYAARMAAVADFAAIRPSRHTPAAAAAALVAALREGVGLLPHEVDGGRDFEELAAAERRRGPAPRLFVVTLARHQPGFDAERYRGAGPGAPSS